LFIDDLEVVLLDKLFSEKPLKIFFDPDDQNSRSSLIRTKTWEDHIKLLKAYQKIGKGGLEYYCRKFSQIPDRIDRIEHTGNNNLLVLSGRKDKNSIVLKSYFKHPGDLRNRGKAEFSALSLLWTHSFTNIPRPYDFDDQLQFGLYEYIPSKKGEQKTDTVQFIKETAKFLTDLNHLSHKVDLTQIQEGSDSRKKLSDYVKIIDRRIESILEGCRQNSELIQVQTFLETSVLPLKKVIFDHFFSEITRLGIDVEREFPDVERTLSPSDFGLHNTILRPSGELVFIDFEYFGKDDPAKQIADFFHHVAQQISWKEKWDLYHYFKSNCAHPESFSERFNLVVDLIGLEWILIVLNIAAPGGLERKIHANPSLNAKKIIEDRLKKAMTMVSNIDIISQNLDAAYITIPGPIYESKNRLS
jgi:thiamine kinase-like enzyme